MKGEPRKSRISPTGRYAFLAAQLSGRIYLCVRCVIIRRASVILRNTGTVAYLPRDTLEVTGITPEQGRLTRNPCDQLANVSFPFNYACLRSPLRGSRPVKRGGDWTCLDNNVSPRCLEIQGPWNLARYKATRGKPGETVKLDSVTSCSPRRNALFINASDGLTERKQKHLGQSRLKHRAKADRSLDNALCNVRDETQSLVRSRRRV